MGNEYDKALSSALRYLTGRDHTEAETSRYLSKKGFSPASIESALGTCKKQSYIDDRRFSARWVESRSKNSSKSNTALRMELTTKGVSSDLLEEAIQTIDETDAAIVAAEKAAWRWKPLPWDEFSKKISASLSRKGFSFETILRVLEKLKERR